MFFFMKPKTFAFTNAAIRLCMGRGRLSHEEPFPVSEPISVRTDASLALCQPSPVFPILIITVLLTSRLVGRISEKLPIVVS